MRKVIYVLCITVIVSGCTGNIPNNSFNAIVTFPVNNQCHDYVTQLSVNSDIYEMSYKRFTVKMDAFPQIAGFMELRSNSMMNLELQNEAIKIMDNCFARAKTTITLDNISDWSNVGKAVQLNTVNGVPIHSLVLNDTSIDIYYNWDDKKEVR